MNSILTRLRKKLFPKQISSFPGINFDHPRTTWQKKHKELFVSMASAYEWILIDLEKNGTIENDHLVFKSSDFQSIALGNILAAAMRRLKRITYVSWAGDAEAGLILTRSLFDYAVSSLLIRQTPDNAELYLKFGAIENKRTLDRFEKYFPPLEKDKKAKEETQKFYDEFAPLFKGKDNKVRKHWHPVKSLSDRSNLVGLNAHYDLGFTRYSDLSHGGFSALMQHASHGAEQWKFSLISKETDIFEAITESSKHLMIIFAAFAHTLAFEKFSDALIDGYGTLNNHEDYKNCLNKNPWLKKWIGALKKS